MPIDPDVLAIVVDALEAAANELEDLSYGHEGMREAILPDSVAVTYPPSTRPWPWVIRRIARAAPPGRKRRLGAMCRQAFTESWEAAYDVPEIRIPVMAEVLTQTEDALELVRRRSLVDGDVRDALRSVA